MARGRKKKVLPGQEWLLDKPEWLRSPEIEAKAKKDNEAILAGFEEMEKGIKRLFGGVGIPLQLACEMNDLYDESMEGHRSNILKRYLAAVRKTRRWRAAGTETTRLQGHQRWNCILTVHRDWIAGKRAEGWSVNRIACVFHVIVTGDSAAS